MLSQILQSFNRKRGTPNEYPTIKDCDKGSDLEPSSESSKGHRILNNEQVDLVIAAQSDQIVPMVSKKK